MKSDTSAARHPVTQWCEKTVSALCEPHSCFSAHLWGYLHLYSLVEPLFPTNIIYLHTNCLINQACARRVYALGTWLLPWLALQEECRSNGTNYFISRGPSALNGGIWADFEYLHCAFRLHKTATAGIAMDACVSDVLCFKDCGKSPSINIVNPFLIISEQ